MPGASQRSPGWADLQPELLLQVAELLDSKNRRRLVGTCRSWYAAVEAAPSNIWPAAVLVCPPLEVTGADNARQAYKNDTAHSLSLVRAAAQVPDLTWLVRIEGEAQPTAALASIAVLPAGVRWLELDISPCAGPMLPLLQRFSRLQCLAINGNGADIDWDVGPPSVLAPLQQLCLDYRRPPTADPDDFVELSTIEAVPSTVRRALAAAIALHTLELRLTWSDEVAVLCRALSGLRNLSLHLYECESSHAAAAVQLLHALPKLTGACLGVHSCSGSELDEEYPDLEAWGHCVRLPALGSLTALTQLCLAGWVQLPPDFCQLAQLQHLAVAATLSADRSQYEWASAPLTGLTALTRIETVRSDYTMDLPDANVLASVPHLAELHAPASTLWRARAAAWRAHLEVLRPDVRITP